MSQYIFDNAAVQAVQRFESLEALYDSRTIRFLNATGVDSGWRCLEVGAGGGSIAAWLSDRVGTNGHVLVTDIDPSHLAALTASGRPNLKIELHDVGVDPLPEATFDLIHARLVLIHVPQRVAALSRLVGALNLAAGSSSRIMLNSSSTAVFQLLTRNVTRSLPRCWLRWSRS